MGTGRPIPALILNQEERVTLERWARRPKTAQALAQRARIILGCSSGKSNSRVAEQMHITKQCVGKWRSRFLAKRLDGLLDEPRPGAPRAPPERARPRRRSPGGRSAPPPRRNVKRRARRRSRRARPTRGGAR